MTPKRKRSGSKRGDGGEKNVSTKGGLRGAKKTVKKVAKKAGVGHDRKKARRVKAAAGARKGSRKRGKGAVRKGRAVGGSVSFVGVGRSGSGAGLAVLVAVAESVGGEWDVAQAKDERVSRRKGSGGVMAAMTRAARGIATKQRIKKLAGTLGALGHPARVAMLVKLLEGPATYRALQKVSRLKAGPLYHHVNQLRLASLILPKQRDLYALTRGGRNVLVGGLALMSLAGDQRERPAVGG